MVREASSYENSFRRSLARLAVNVQDFLVAMKAMIVRRASYGENEQGFMSVSGELIFRSELGLGEEERPAEIMFKQDGPAAKSEDPRDACLLATIC